MITILNKFYKDLSKLLKYGLGALMGLLIDFLSVVILVEVFELYYILAISVGFILGLIITFEFSNRFVFGKSRIQKKNLFILFGSIGLIGLLILNVIVWLLTEFIGVNYIFSKIIATFFVFLWNFYARKSLYHDGATD